MTAPVSLHSDWPLVTGAAVALSAAQVEAPVISMTTNAANSNEPAVCPAMPVVDADALLVDDSRDAGND